MRIKRIIIGFLIGAAIGAALEYANMLLTFLLPPFFVLLPLTVLVGAVLGAATKNATHSPLIVQVQGLGHLPICAAEFIRLLVKKMRYSRKVRLDVQAELTAHFDDELKDCTTDEDKEQKARQLIAEFGDVKLLAVLLRRAKKRCRPLWRTAFARMCQAVVLVFVCFVIYVAWFLSGKPSVTTNYVAQLNRLVQPTADESLNAAPLYEKAIEKYTELPDDISGLSGTRYTELAPEQKRAVEKWLKEEKEVFDLLIAATHKPCYWREYQSDNKEMISISMPNLMAFRKLAFALRWRAQLRAHDGRYDDAFGDVKSCYCLGRHLKTGPFLIEQLVGFSIQNLAAETCRDIVANHNVAPNTISKLQQDFGEMVAGEDFTVGLDAEKLSVFDEIQRSFTEGFRGGHLIPSRIAELSDLTKIITILSLDHPTGAPTKKQKPGWFSAFIANLRYDICEFGGFIYEAGGSVKKAGYMLFLHPDKQQTFQAAEELYDYWEGLAGKTPYQIRIEGLDTEEQARQIIGENVLLELLEAAFGRVIELSHLNRTESQALVAVLALLRHKNDKQLYPENLEELITADYLKQLPIDLYSNKPLVYKKTDTGFVLYSIGPDFADNGGEPSRDKDGRVRKWRHNGDTVFWPVPKSRLKK